MSELDILLRKKKNTEENSDKNTENNEELRKNDEKSNDTDEQNEKIINIMEKFLDRDPKIGVWSYPAFLVLQYLYHTTPGFRMSKVAKEALEKGLRDMYPTLFEIAEKIAERKYK